ncbi:MAG: transcription elongation factor GreA [Candidatus Doudnabacteria bacterium]
MTKKYLLTKEGLEKLNAELKVLVTEKRKDVIERIRDAASHGDLSENADYAQAREEQSFIEGRIMEIEDMIKNAEIITESKQRNSVTIGSKVVVSVNKEEKTYFIVGSNEANPSEGKISNESAVGIQMLGKKVGDKFIIETPVGPKEYEVVSIN